MQDLATEQRERQALAVRTDRRLNRAGTFANLGGAAILFVFLGFLVPTSIDSDQFGEVVNRNLIAFVVYMGITLPLGRWITRRHYWAGVSEWLRSGRPATVEERQMVLAYPRSYSRVSTAMWVFAGVFFALFNAGYGADLAVTILAAVALGTVTNWAVGYLIVERLVREVTALALAGGPPPPGSTPGVRDRLKMAWVAATGVPLLGAAVIAGMYLAGVDMGARSAVGAILFLLVLGLAVGLLAISVAARSVADPVGAVSRALDEVEGGDFGVRVPVDDGSEVGMLEAGFNRMAAGLAERERLRDLFGRHVGREVARAALDGEARLGGEVRDVGVLFVDVVGSTTIAAEREPTDVVTLLNSFFRLVVEAIERHRGWVNKFEGDAALAVFGAPVSTSDPAGDALGAARELRDRLAAELPEIDVGIGVSMGPAVAGNVGAEERYEYTVIGDPVNEAARLCELAKARPERVLASERAVEQADPEERTRWSVGEAVALRGRPAATRLATVAA